MGTTSDKLASVSQAIDDSLDDIKQLAARRAQHAAEFANIYQPAQGALRGRCR